MLIFIKDIIQKHSFAMILMVVVPYKHVGYYLLPN
jgi:hypothetical protein